MTEKTKPQVTIAIPTYNRADGFLSEALESALAQTYDRIEIIVADNCSTDGTPVLMQNYTGEEGLRYVRHEENLGPHRNFNFCLNAARGVFFLMLHDDDKIDPDFVETCIDALDQTENVGYVRTGVRLINESGVEKRCHPNRAEGTTGAEAVLNWMRCKNFWTLSSTLYETEILRSVGGFSENEFPLTCDCLATVNIALENCGVEIQPVKASFRVHKEQATHKGSVRQWINEWHRFYQYVIKHAPSSSVRRLFRHEGANFFSMLAYNHAERISSTSGRCMMYALVYSKFMGGHLPPPVSKVLHSVKRRMLE